MRLSLIDIELKDDLIPVPYIPVSKCKGLYKAAEDNGRVLSAEVIGEITLTDIDYNIIRKQYKFKIAAIHTVATARYGMLPAPLRECVLTYYRDKTQIRDKPTDQEHTAEFYELLYQKSKNLLNAQYGMCAQDPVKVSMKYTNGNNKDPEDNDLYEEDDTAPEDLLEQHNKRAFLVYQWGVWITARAREHLQKGIDLCGDKFVYCDTDSCKFIGNVDFSSLNKEEIAKAKKFGAYAKDQKGKVHYMGVFEAEKPMLRYVTMGAKKYAYEVMDENGEPELHITIAGVNKRIGAVELKRAGGLEAMEEGFCFKYAGGLEAKYNDFPEVTQWYNEDHVPIRITRNIALKPNTKTLGLKEEYRELLDGYRTYNIDMI